MVRVVVRVTFGNGSVAFTNIYISVLKHNDVTLKIQTARRASWIEGTETALNADGLRYNCEVPKST